MDLIQNRLLGEHHRASSTMHLLWRDFQQFVVIKVNHYIRLVINWSQLVVVNAVEIVQGQWMRSITHLRISVCDPLTKKKKHFYCIYMYSHADFIKWYSYGVNHIIQFNTNILSHYYIHTDVTNNGKPMNASLSEDSVAETALAKKNSDGE